ncbi:MAG TPA: hypothetical protein VMU20_09090 [Candidatus Dormibacteraeota bacterium]|jgi:hypothetical protein|nr:hypothetical protein [Candidatus Dormibacteraeota bacterium]
MRSAVLRHRDTDAATRVTANWIDPDRVAVRALLLVLMLLSLHGRGVPRGRDA